MPGGLSLPGINTKDLVEEQKQKQLLAAACKKKDKDGQPTGVDISRRQHEYLQGELKAILFKKAKSQETRSVKTHAELQGESLSNQKDFIVIAACKKKEKDSQAAGIDNSRGQHDSYVQRQQKAIFEKAKSQETRSGKNNSELHGESVLNEKDIVECKKRLLAAAGRKKKEKDEQRVDIDEVKRLRELLSTVQAEKSQLSACLQTAEKEREELQTKLADSVKKSDERLDEERAKLAIMMKKNDELRTNNIQLQKQILNDDQQNDWFKKKLSMVKSENEEYKKQIDEMAELSQINLDSVSVSKRKLGGGSFGGILTCPLSST